VTWASPVWGRGRGLLNTTRDSAISYEQGMMPGFDNSHCDAAAELRMPSTSFQGGGFVLNSGELH